MSIHEDRRKYEKELMSKKNVSGVMTALKTKNGVVTDQMAVTCMVSKKTSIGQLDIKDIIPVSVGDSPTDVIEVGEVKALGLHGRPTVIDRKTRIRPAPMGTSGGHHQITAGTNGELLHINGGMLCIGTNNHVGAMSNDAEIGDPYLQPGPHDGGSYPDDTIGYLYRFVPIKFFNVPSECSIAGTVTSIMNLFSRLFGHKTRLIGYYASNESNLVDAAAIVLKVDDDVLAHILDIGVPKGHRDALRGDLVQKSGRTTEHTMDGEITAIDATINVNYGGIKMATFTDQIIISKPGFSAGGDSGSLILTMENYAVGKLFAGSDQITIANHIGNYLNLLDAELVTEESVIQNE